MYSFFNVYLFVYFYVWINFIFSNFLKMCQLGKYVIYMCRYIEQLRTGQKGVLVCGNGKFQSVMDEIAVSFHFGLLCLFLWVQTNEKFYRKSF